MLACKLFYDGQLHLLILCCKIDCDFSYKKGISLVVYPKYSSLYNEYVMADMLKITRQSFNLLCLTFPT